MSLAMLDRKVVRDLTRLWAQVLAIALVMACGVMTIVLAVGAYRSLDETRHTYYDRYRFGHVFATANRAPLSLGREISRIDGVASVGLRIVEPAVLDIPGMAVPASGIAISLPVTGEPPVNALYLRSGRLPRPDAPREIAVDERFAKAHGFHPGDSFAAVLGGHKLTLTITAIVLSPEYVYAIGPGDMVPDDRRFAVFWMPRKAMEGLFDMTGAFNDLSLILLRGASERRVVDAVDHLLEPYGGRGAYGRSEQISNAFLSSELTQLNAMARVIPPVFLFVSAFLVNMILSRLVALEREQIGLLKACGYSAAAIAWHYAKLVIAIALIGLAIGGSVGNWLGHGLTRLYADYFSFPFLIFRQSIDLYVMAAAVSVASAIAGAAKAIWTAVRLPPAVAMRPPAPARYRTVLGGRSGVPRLMSQLTTMALRQMVHRPLRTALTTLGVSFSVALLVTAMFSSDSIDVMIDTIFFRAERADARLTFGQEVAPEVIHDVARLPGVMRAETFRSVPVILRNAGTEKRVAITGIAPGTRLSQVLDLDGNPVAMPENGLLLTDRLARQLQARPGTLVSVELIAQGRRVVDVPVTAIVESYVGLSAHMDLAALDRLAGPGPRVSGAWIDVDASRLEALYDKVKALPALGAIALQNVSRDKFRQSIGENILTMMTVYIAIAVIVAFGVVYNSARIQLSERARELASLRVLGFTRAEVSHVLLTEMAIVALAAQPLGWLIGYAFSLSVIKGFASDLFRVPFVIYPSTYAIASLVVLAAAGVSALIVRRRVNRLDMIRVLKTRE
ncbi:ABC transporter permease [Zhengella mangrovi]|uniref:ABC transporter permease n=1 Tax=Zhengella mangrovi TaxID=1982044 RepID=UPI0026D13BD9